MKCLAKIYLFITYMSLEDILQQYTNNSVDRESGQINIHQDGGSFLSFAVPTGLFIMNHLYKPNQSLDKIKVVENKDHITEENFTKFLSNPTSTKKRATKTLKGKNKREKVKKTRKRRM